MRPAVAAVIVSYNRAADLRLSLTSLQACGYPRLRIVVVDNASGDDSLAVARSFADVRVVEHEENLGFAAAVNAGLERALAEGAVDYVALINNDAVVARDWIDRLVDFLEAQKDAAAAAGKIYFWDYPGEPGSQATSYYAFSKVDALTGHTEPLIDAPDRVTEVATLSGAAVMVRVSAIDAIGRPFLEPSFFLYYEETDFFARAIRRGFKLFYTGEPAAWHRVRGSSSSYTYHHYMERNRLLYAYRNFSERGLAHAVQQTLRGAGRQLARPKHLWRTVRGDEQARARLDAWRWLLANRGRLRAERVRAHDERPFEELVEGIQSRASYYDHERPEVLALVPEEARVVVDVGCGGGGLARGLKRARPGLRVYGVEPSAAVERAREALDGVAAAGAEAGLPPGFPQPDVVIFADVLEHLAEPLPVLKRWRSAMAPNGTLLASLPNVAHASVAVPLFFRGSFRYVDAGVLDRTHLRFFTRESAIELLREAGFRVTYASRVADVPAGLLPEGWRARVHRWTKGVPTEAVGALRGRVADLYTVQFLLVAKNDGAGA